MIFYSQAKHLFGFLFLFFSSFGGEASFGHTFFFFRDWGLDWMGGTPKKIEKKRFGWLVYLGWFDFRRLDLFASFSLLDLGFDLFWAVCKQGIGGGQKKSFYFLGGFFSSGGNSNHLTYWYCYSSLCAFWEHRFFVFLLYILYCLFPGAGRGWLSILWCIILATCTLSQTGKG